MSNLLNLALIQMPASEDRRDNLRRGLDAARRAAQEGAQVVAFAELAFEPFYPQCRAQAGYEQLAEPIPGPTTAAFCELAAELGIVITINLFEDAGRDPLGRPRTYDASPVIDADGTLLGVTRMLHITDYEGFHEKGYYTPGDSGAPVYDTRFGRLGIAICYDRHYPEYLRALALAGADLVLVPQAGAVGEWPEGLYEAEMRVAAFQNGYFVGLCNRVGPEPRLTFAGESFVCDPQGRVVARAGQGTTEILHSQLDLAELPASPARRLFLPDRRPELYAQWFGQGSPPA